MAASAAALRLMRRRLSAPPPAPMLRSLFPVSYSQAAAAGSLPAVCHAPLPPPLAPSLLRHYCRKVTPKGEQRCCTTIPNTKSDAIKSLLDSLRNLKDSKKTFQDKQRCCNNVSNTKSDNTKSLLDNLKDMKEKSLQDIHKNIKEHTEIVHKAWDDCRNVHALFEKRLNDLKKLNAMIRKVQGDCMNVHVLFKKRLNVVTKLFATISRISKLMDDVEKGFDIVDFSQSLIGEQLQILEEEMENYHNAIRRHEELERFVVKKVARVCAAVGLGGGLLLILAFTLG